LQKKQKNGNTPGEDSIRDQRITKKGDGAGEGALEKYGPGRQHITKSGSTSTSEHGDLEAGKKAIRFEGSRESVNLARKAAAKK